MANHKGAAKKSRADEKKRLRNRYQLKTARTFIKRLLAEKDKSEAEKQLQSVISMVDKLSKRNIIHKNKAANQKSRLTKYVSTL